MVKKTCKAKDTISVQEGDKDTKVSVSSKTIKKAAT